MDRGVVTARPRGLYDKLSPWETHCLGARDQVCLHLCIWVLVLPEVTAFCSGDLVCSRLIQRNCLHATVEPNQTNTARAKGWALLTSCSQDLEGWRTPKGPLLTSLKEHACRLGFLCPFFKHCPLNLYTSLIAAFYRSHQEGSRMIRATPRHLH
jgi:hypothetical protein